MRLAICQLEIKFEDKPYNLSKIHTMVKQASEQETELILLPEMSLTGFSVNTKVTQEFEHETLDSMKQLARDFQVAIGFGWVKGGAVKAENHYTVVDASAAIISDYIKIHPFSYGNENQYFQGGDSISFFTLNQVRFCTFICYDLRFPEIFQLASSKASIIIVAANWPAERKEHWQCLLRARAIENQCYIIGVNCVGWQKSLYYSGDSSIINPNGDMLHISKEFEALQLFEIENDVGKYRNRFPTQNDRKTELYKQLSETICSHTI